MMTVMFTPMVLVLLMLLLLVKGMLGVLTRMKCPMLLSLGMVARRMPG